MLALIAGTGDLPGAVVAALRSAGQPDPLICEMRGFVADVPEDLPRLGFRMEQIGSFLAKLTGRGITDLCLAGAMLRPVIDPSAIDAATAPLVPRIMAAMSLGDNGTLAAFISIFEAAGLHLRAAHQIAPRLLPPAGVLTRVGPGTDVADGVFAARAAFADMARRDIGQSCILHAGRVIAQEPQTGTDTLIGMRQVWPAGAVLVKAPKPGQDLRADLPVIGPQTADRVLAHGLSGIVLAQGGVMVLHRDRVLQSLDAGGGFLWVTPL